MTESDAYQKRINRETEGFLQEKRKITIGGMSPEELLKQLGEDKTNQYARDMIRSPSFTTLAKPTKIEVTLVPLRMLGFTSPPTLKKIIDSAKSMGELVGLGLNVVPAETGPHAYLQDKANGLLSRYYIAMDPIIDEEDHLCFFELRNDNGVLSLHGIHATPNTTLSLNSTFLFGVSKQPRWIDTIDLSRFTKPDPPR